MSKLWRQVRSFPVSVQLLFVNQFSINAGFYMLMPYLADYLAGDLQLAAWAIGLVLGIRNLGQQGMFFLGGALADKFGYKPLIIAGLLLRTVAFALLALVTSLPALIVASALIGLAGAMFNPAVRAYVAQGAAQRRVEAFAIFNMFYQAGLLVGPLIGLVLLATDFRLICAVTAALFALLGVIQIVALPAREALHAESANNAAPAGLRTGLKIASDNRQFLVFSLVMAAATLLTFQTYLVLPLQLRSIDLAAQAAGVWTAVLFGVSGVVAICAQSPITAWARRRMRARQILSAGLAIAGLAFFPLVIATAIGTPAGVIAAVLAAGAVLGIASALTYPFEMDMIVTLARDRYVATHYGLYSTITGVTVSVGNLAVGAAIGFADKAGNPALPAAILVTLGIVAGFGLRAMRRLDAPQPPPASARNAQHQQRLPVAVSR